MNNNLYIQSYIPGIQPGINNLNWQNPNSSVRMCKEQSPFPTMRAKKYPSTSNMLTKENYHVISIWVQEQLGPNTFSQIIVWPIFSMTNTVLNP